MPLKRDELASTGWRAVVEAYQTCANRYAQLMSHFDLTPTQFDVLLVIEKLGPEATPKAIADGLLVTKGNITSVTKRLLERGLISQQAHNRDGRSIVLALTEQGRTIMKPARKASMAFVREQLAPFDDKEIMKTAEQMRRMRTHLASDEFTVFLNKISSS